MTAQRQTDGDVAVSGDQQDGPDGQCLADGRHWPGVRQDVRVQRVEEPRQLVGEVVQSLEWLNEQALRAYTQTHNPGLSRAVRIVSTPHVRDLKLDGHGNVPLFLIKRDEPTLILLMLAFVKASFSELNSLLIILFFYYCRLLFLYW